MKEIHYHNFVNKMDDVFQTYAEKTAIVDYISEEIVKRYSYEELFEYAMQVKMALARQNVITKERVAILIKPSAHSAMLLLALSYLGYVAVLLDASLPFEERNRVLQEAEPSALITTETLIPSLEEELWASRPVFCLQGAEGILLRNPKHKEWKKSELPRNEDVIAMIYALDANADMQCAEVTCQEMAFYASFSAQYAEYDAKARFLHILPQTQVAGYTMLFINFLQGSEMAFVPEISNDGLTMGLRSYEPTHLFMLPKVYESIRNRIETEIEKRPKGAQLLFHSCKALSSTVRRVTGRGMKNLMKPFYASAFGRNIQVIGCEAAPCPVETVRFFRDMGIDFLNMYGSLRNTVLSFFDVFSHRVFPAFSWFFLEK